MAETKHILVLANSARAGKHCVAGKAALPLGNGRFHVGREWIRLADPRDSEGAVPFACTVYPNKGGLVRPLDIIKVALRGHCADPNHPEDWWFEPDQRWELAARNESGVLSGIADHPISLWHDGFENKSVKAGYVTKKTAGCPATLCLLKAPSRWTFEFWKERNRFNGKDEVKRRLYFSHAGRQHEFSVTDTDFTRRHKIFDRATEQRQTLAVPNPEDTYFCLSLTKLTPEFNGKHYKICATVFELE